MIKLLRKIHFAYFILCVFISFALFWPFYYCFSREEKYYGLLNRLRKMQSYLVAMLVGIRFKFTFEQPLNKNKTYIYCANHSSTLDIMIMCVLGQGRYHFMGKEELKKNPILGIFFKTIDVAVSRESKMSSFRAFKKAGDNLANGMSLMIFPEGKIDDVYPPVLQEFKNGPFRLAIDKNIAVVPVSITNAWELLWDSGVKLGSKPGIVNVYVHEPILTSILALENDEALKAKVYDKINSKLLYGN